MTEGVIHHKEVNQFEFRSRASQVGTLYLAAAKHPADDDLRRFPDWHRLQAVSYTHLSGGNQQKVVLAKWLSREPKVLILDNPTQGVDVGAKEEIYDIILKLAKEGVSVIVLSSEAQEIIRVCDRALVMYHGEIVGEVSGETMTEHEIMRLATGG